MPRAIAPPASSAMSSAARAEATTSASMSATRPKQYAAALRRPRAPQVRRADRDATEHARREAMAEIGRLDADPHERRHGRARLLQRGLGRREARAREGGELARDPEDREAVGAVRRDLDLEDMVVQTQEGDEVLAEPRVGVEEEDPRLVLVAEPQLALRAEHPLRFDAADLRRRDAPAAGEHRAGRRERGARADLGVGRPADHGEALAAGRDAAEEQAAAVAVAELALDRLDLADDDAGEARGRQRSDARHLDARVDEPVGRVGRAEREVRELPDPAIRDIHANE